MILNFFSNSLKVKGKLNVNLRVRMEKKGYTTRNVSNDFKVLYSQINLLKIMTN